MMSGVMSVAITHHLLLIRVMSGLTTNEGRGVTQVIHRGQHRHLAGKLRAQGKTDGFINNPRIRATPIDDNIKQAQKQKWNLDLET